MKEEFLKGLSEEQIAKVKDCNNNEEILALAKQEGIELTDEQLEAVNGGCTRNMSAGRTRQGWCHKCNRYVQCKWLKTHGGNGGTNYLKCPDCGHEFWYF